MFSAVSFELDVNTIILSIVSAVVTIYLAKINREIGVVKKDVNSNTTNILSQLATSRGETAVSRAETQRLEGKLAKADEKAIGIQRVQDIKDERRGKAASSGGVEEEMEIIVPEQTLAVVPKQEPSVSPKPEGGGLPGGGDK